MASPTVLLTGATGFIGGATLARLLESHPECRVLVLARDRGSLSALERVRRSLTRFVGAERAEQGMLACQVISGDLTDPTSLDQDCLDGVTHVLHLAALRKLAGKRLEDVGYMPRLVSDSRLHAVRRVRHTNVLGTLTLAQRLRRVASLQRLVHVSTAHICGEKSPAIVHEEMYPHQRARHFTEYTASKAECEMLLERTAAELPLVVARPSTVVGHTRLGCLPSASVFWFYRACALLHRTTCSLDLRDDAVPVDWVADALLLLLLKPTLRHRRYHVSAGLASSTTRREIAALLAACHGEEFRIPYEVVDIPTILAERKRLPNLLGPGDIDHLLTALQVFYRFMQRGAEVFDNTRLLAEGMPPAPRLTDYLHRCATLPTGQSVYEQMLDDFGSPTTFGPEWSGEGNLPAHPASRREYGDAFQFPSRIATTAAWVKEEWGQGDA